MAIARAFLAVVPARRALDAVTELTAALQAREPAFRWAPRDHWHLTIRFLGRVDDEAALVAAVADATRAIAPARVRLQGVGAFPTARRARVLWVGVGEGADRLHDMAGTLEMACDPLGYATPNDSRFTPHLTIAKLRAPADTRPLLVVGPVGPAWTADEVVLFESRLNGPPPRYVPRARFPLGGSASGPEPGSL